MQGAAVDAAAPFHFHRSFRHLFGVAELE